MRERGTLLSIIGFCSFCPIVMLLHGCSLTTDRFSCGMKTDNQLVRCVDYENVGVAFRTTVETLCRTLGGDFSTTETCPQPRIGGCREVASGYTQTAWYYPGSIASTPAEVMGRCSGKSFYVDANGNRVDSSADLSTPADMSVADQQPAKDLAMAAGDITATANGVARSFTTQSANYAGTGTSIVGANGTFQGIALLFPGKAPGTFACGAAGVGVNYSDGTAHWTTINKVDAKCTITVTEYGPVGGKISGTFSATTLPLINEPNNVVLESGIFSVVRQSDK